jgi:hypothetical protein
MNVNHEFDRASHRRQSIKRADDRAQPTRKPVIEALSRSTRLGGRRERFELGERLAITVWGEPNDPAKARAVSGTSSPEHLEENWQARTINLTKDEVGAIAREARGG